MSFQPKAFVLLYFRRSLGFGATHSSSIIF
jgi:hypothetical protein